MRKALFSIIFISTLGSCLDQPACIDSTTNRIEIEFKSIADGSELTITLDSIYITTPEVVLYKEVAISMAEIPLYPDRNEIRIVMESDQADDYIDLEYSVTPKLNSEFCDVQLNFTDFKVITTIIDSLALDLTNTPPKIEIYY